MLRRNSRFVRVLLSAALACGVLALMTASQQNQAQKKPESKPLASPTIEGVKPTLKPKDVALKTSGATRRGLDFYAKAARASMFGEPQPPAPKPVPPPPPPKPAPPPPPVEVDPFADWAYTGTVSFSGQKMALLENVKSKEGQYLRIGESFMGGQVSEINDSQVTLMAGGKMRQLTKQQNVNLVPLNASAAPGGQTGQPGMPPPPGGAPPPPGSVTMMGGSFISGNTFTPSPTSIRRLGKRAIIR